MIVMSKVAAVVKTNVKSPVGGAADKTTLTPIQRKRIGDLLQNLHTRFNEHKKLGKYPLVSFQELKDRIKREHNYELYFGNDKAKTAKTRDFLRAAGFLVIDSDKIPRTIQTKILPLAQKAELEEINRPENVLNEVIWSWIQITSKVPFIISEKHLIEMEKKIGMIGKLVDR